MIFLTLRVSLPGMRRFAKQSGLPGAAGLGTDPHPVRKTQAENGAHQSQTSRARIRTREGMDEGSYLSTQA